MAESQPNTTGSFSYQSAAVPRGELSSGLCYLARDKSGSDEPPVGLDPVEVSVEVINGRAAGLESLTLDSAGFMLTPHCYAHIDYMNEDAIVGPYYAEVCDLVRRTTGASKVVAFDHNIRASETKSWMNQDGQEVSGQSIAGGNKVQSPAMVVHNDYTKTSAPLRLDLLSQPPKANDTWAKTSTDNAPLIDPLALAALKSKRYQFINVWRSIADEPVTDMPLALCHGATVSREDLVTFEIRYADRVGENYFAGHSPRHRWFFFPQMTRDEAVLLKVWDSAGALCSPEGAGEGGGVATFSLHSAFRDPAAPPDGPKRRSIEVRTVAFFD